MTGPAREVHARRAAPPLDQAQDTSGSVGTLASARVGTPPPEAVTVVAVARRLDASTPYRGATLILIDGSQAATQRTLITLFTQVNGRYRDATKQSATCSKQNFDQHASIMSTGMMPGVKRQGAQCK